MPAGLNMTMVSGLEAKGLGIDERSTAWSGRSLYVPFLD